MKNKKVLIGLMVISLFIGGVYIFSKKIPKENNIKVDKPKFTLFYSDSIEYVGESSENSITSKIFTISQAGEVLKSLYFKELLINDNKYELDGKIYFTGYELSESKSTEASIVLEVDKYSLKLNKYYISKDKSSTYIFSDIYADKNSIFLVGGGPSLGEDTLLKIDKLSKKITSVNIENPDGGKNIKIREADNNLFLVSSYKTTRINRDTLKTENTYDLELRENSVQYIHKFKKIDGVFYIMGKSKDIIYKYDPIKDSFSLETNMTLDKT